MNAMPGVVVAAARHEPIERDTPENAVLDIAEAAVVSALATAKACGVEAQLLARLERLLPAPVKTPAPIQPSQSAGKSGALLTPMDAAAVLVALRQGRATAENAAAKAIVRPFLKSNPEPLP